MSNPMNSITVTFKGTQGASQAFYGDDVSRVEVNEFGVVIYDRDDEGGKTGTLWPWWQIKNVREEVWNG